MDTTTAKHLRVGQVAGISLALGATLWASASLYQLGAKNDLVAWFGGPGMIVLGLGHVLLAWGAWGGGRRGRLMAVGRLALFVAAAGWVFFGVGALVAPRGVDDLLVVARISVLIAEVAAAVVIVVAGAASGAARWILLLPAGWMVASPGISAFGSLEPAWSTLALAAAFLVAGLVYAVPCSVAE